MHVTENLLSEFRELEREIAAEKGDFVLFALLSREDLPDRWDLVLSAPWIQSKNQTIAFFLDRIRSRFSEEDFVRVSRIVLAEVNHEEIKAINRSINVKHGDVEIRDVDLFGVRIKEGHIITSSAPNQPLRNAIA